MHDMITACQQEKVEQMYIKRKCGYSFYLDTVNCSTQKYVGHSNMLDPLHFGYLPSKYAKFGICAPFRPLFNIYIVYIFYGPSIIHKDDNFAKSEFILYEKQESSNFGIRCWSLSVVFIPLTVRDRGNSSTYYRKLSANQFKEFFLFKIKIYLYIVLSC